MFTYTSIQIAPSMLAAQLKRLLLNSRSGVGMLLFRGAKVQIKTHPARIRN